MIELQLGKKYELASGDIIEVFDEAIFGTVSYREKGYDTIILDKKPERICKARLFELKRPLFYTTVIEKRMATYDWPGQKVGDIIEYMADRGLYCGFDNRSFLLHVLREAQ